MYGLPVRRELGPILAQADLMPRQTQFCAGVAPGLSTERRATPGPSSHAGKSAARLIGTGTCRQALRLLRAIVGLAGGIDAVERSISGDSPRGTADLAQRPCSA